MQLFQYTKATSIAQAQEIARRAKTAQQGADVRFIAGGTTLLDLMKLDVEHPTRVVDINHLGLDAIERTSDGAAR